MAELNGKSHVIVFPDGNMEKAVPQVCVWINFEFWTGFVFLRIEFTEIVHEFMQKKHIEEINSLKQGDRVERIVHTSNASNTGVSSYIVKFFDEGKKAGAKTVTGGGHHGNNQYLFNLSYS